ncbi:MAG: hypothetical protein H6710_03420 [Myxococcales bacterium]|nr:hypothetical protein [Myxococcales bacterium]MCB9702684.1 hypothetical protein [Myxococcales bacterium]
MSARAVALALPLAALAAALAAACVIPDRDIIIKDETISNRYAVRIVEPLRLTVEASEACDDPETDPLEECPQPPPDDPRNVLPHFLDPSNPLYAFCSCPKGQGDAGAQPTFSIYIEDRDLDAQNEPDEIFAALLLDYTPTNAKPHDSVRYRNFVNPQEPLPRAASIDYQPIGRPDPLLRELTLGNEFRPFDLCNGAIDTPLSPGFHSLSVIVTDRPWFTPDDDGLQTIQEGVPDLAAGATFDVLTYVFFCAESGSATCDGECIAPEEPL